MSEVANPELSRFEGRPFADVLAAWPGHPSDVLARWALETEAQPCLIKSGGADADYDYLGSLLDDEATLVGGSDAVPTRSMFCGAGDTTLLLTRHVRERNDLTLERVVHKLTGLAARAFGIRDRGVLVPGRRETSWFSSSTNCTTSLNSSWRTCPVGHGVSPDRQVATVRPSYTAA